jgi:ubiquitin C-terminal hydrolase
MGQGGTVTTRDFWSAMLPAAMKEGFEQFRIMIPHDAHEFLVFILDQIHEALAEDVIMTIHHPQGDLPKNKDVNGALSFWKKNFEKKYSPIVELLFGVMRKSVVCEGCKAESVTWETMNINKVSVPKGGSEPLSVIDLMREDCKGETIDEYACDTCKPVRHSAIVTRAYWRLGNWVIVTLKRNENNGRKINRVVDIPKTVCFDELFHKNSEETSVKASYELFATVDHHGHGGGGGHYTSYSKHSVSGKWIFYDDESGVEVPDVVINTSTYIVMYRKV